MANWISPVDGGISQDYGVKNAGYEAGYHTGLDFSVAAGTGIVAVQKGKVVEAGWNDSYGNYVKIQHPNGYYTLYAHMKRLGVKVGDQVGQSEQIGLSGNTGNSNGAHLHFEVRSGSGQYDDNVDPGNFIGGRGTYQNTGGSGGGGGSNGGGGGDGVKFNENEFEAMLAASGFPEWLVDEFPALKNIYKDAVKHEWTPDRFVGEVKSSDWYQNRSDAQFQWDTTRDAEKKAQIQGFAASLRDQAAQLGVNISNKKINQMAEFALRFGYDANPSRIQDMLANQYDYKDNGATGGTIGTALDQIDSIAWEWGVNMSPKMRKKWAEKIASGDADPAAFRDMAEQRARKDYSWLAESFDSGKTLGEIVDPYRQTMAQMLEISPDEISMKDKQIRKALSFTTGQGKNAEDGLAPIYEFENALRQDARWQKTKNAREEYMNFGMKVLQDFGVMT